MIINNIEFYDGKVGFAILLYEICKEISIINKTLLSQKISRYKIINQNSQHFIIKIEINYLMII